MKKEEPIIWSQFVDPQTGRTVREVIERDDYGYRHLFERVLRCFNHKLSQFERINVHFWYYPYVYIEVKDVRWKHYPCGHRALVSFDLTNGKCASAESLNQYAFARRGWGAFMDLLCGYRVQRYTDCGNRDKTTGC